MMITRKHDQAVVVHAGKIANTFVSRLVGWIGKRQAHLGEGLWFTNSNSAHMWMMSIPIDVVFLSRDRKIVKTFSNLKPWRPLPVLCIGADSMLELPAGTVETLNLKSGEELCIDS
ncbi:MAG: DUF192 domain-containing protein [Bdellovibrionales bacterium]|nr:DUF192 domain-containing protein [Bdellovibrionales bacterium]